MSPSVVCVLCDERVESTADMKAISQHITIHHFPTYTPYRCQNCRRRVGLRYKCCEQSAPLLITGYTADATIEATMSMIRRHSMQPADAQTNAMLAAALASMRLHEDEARANAEFAATPTHRGVEDDIVYVPDHTRLVDRHLLRAEATRLGLGGGEPMDAGPTSPAVKCEICESKTLTARALFEHYITVKHLPAPCKCPSDSCAEMFYYVDEFDAHKVAVKADKAMRKAHGKMDPTALPVLDEQHAQWEDVVKMMRALVSAGLTRDEFEECETSFPEELADEVFN